jgi:hypothetical protein
MDVDEHDARALENSLVLGSLLREVLLHERVECEGMDKALLDLAIPLSIDVGS